MQRFLGQPVGENSIESKASAKGEQVYSSSPKKESSAL